MTDEEFIELKGWLFKLETQEIGFQEAHYLLRQLKENKPAEPLASRDSFSDSASSNVSEVKASSNEEELSKG